MGTGWCLPGLGLAARLLALAAPGWAAPSWYSVVVLATAREGADVSSTVERLLAALNAVKSQRLVWTVERDVALLAEVWRTGAVTGIALPTPKSARVAAPRAGDGSETARAHECRLQEG